MWFRTGSTLNVCSQYLQDELQCCSQSDEDALGIRLSYDTVLGTEIDALSETSYRELISAVLGKFSLDFS